MSQAPSDSFIAPTLLFPRWAEGSIMEMSKRRIAAVLVIVCLAFAVPATVIVTYKLVSPQPASLPASASDNNPTTQPLSLPASASDNNAATQLAVSAEDQRQQAILDKTIHETMLYGISLADSMDFVRALTHANIVVDWPALGDAGIARTTPVNLRAPNMKCSELISTILNSASPDTPLGYKIHDGAIRISTAKKLENN
jgi:hypothetical protein